MKNWGLFFTVLLLVSCGEQAKPVEKIQQTYVLNPQVLSKTLYFSGSVQPIKQTPVIVKDSSVIENVYARYGDRVEKGQKLVQLNSATLHKELNEALTNYLKAKDTYNVTKVKFEGTQQLWDSGLIPKNNYLSEKSSLDTSLISLLQEEEKLKQTANKIQGVNLDKFSKLQLADITKIKKILKTNYNIYTIRANSSGVLLMPPKSTDDGAVDFRPGAHIKENQVIAMIGNMQGVSVNIKISEVDVEKIKKGQKAVIKGVAFPEFPLQGAIVSVGAQASTAASGSSGFPVFEAHVEVPQLTEQQKKIIKVGMTAAVEVDIKSKKVLMVPIQSVFESNGHTMVNVKQKGKVIAQNITTGEASVDKVVVESGLKQGDVVVYE
jgi:HlyD family secretion protein